MKKNGPAHDKAIDPSSSGSAQDVERARTDGAQANHALEEETGAAANKQGHAADDREIGGRDGPDPTRFGDWEKNGRCIDF